MAFNKLLAEKHIKDVKEGGMCQKSKLLCIDKNASAMDKKSQLLSQLLVKYTFLFTVRYHSDVRQSEIG